MSEFKGHSHCKHFSDDSARTAHFLLRHRSSRPSWMHACFSRLARELGGQASHPTYLRGKCFIGTGSPWVSILQEYLTLSFTVSVYRTPVLVTDYAFISTNSWGITSLKEVDRLFQCLRTRKWCRRTLNPDATSRPTFFALNICKYFWRTRTDTRPFSGVDTLLTAPSQKLPP